MPAFYFNSNGSEIFRQGGGAQIVKIPAVDSIVGSGGLAVYSQVTFQVNETLQYFLAFDDVIKFIHFGKAVGNVTAEGILYCDCSGNLPGLSRATSAIGTLRGKAVKLTLGAYTVTGILTSATISALADQDTFGQFAFNFAIVNHS
jgi:hypothetical protein